MGWFDGGALGRRLAGPLVVAVLAVPALAGCGEDTEKAGGLTMGTGNATGVYYVLGRGYADLIAGAMPGYTVTPQVTGGPKQNIDRVVTGQDALGICSLSWASDAITGQGAFREPQPIRALARLYLNYTQVVVRSGISSLKQLRGRPISTGSPGSTGELAAARLLALAGLDVDRDTRRQKVSLDKSVEAMRAGTLDAVFWSGGLPTAGIQDLTEALGSRVTLLDLGAYYDQMRTLFPDVYEVVTIDPAGYGLARPIKTVAEPNMIVVGDSMEPELAGQLTAVLMENLPQLAAVHPEGRNITRALAGATHPVPLHTGALRYYRDHPDAP